MAVGRICTRVVASAAEGETVREAADRMREYNVGTLVVEDGQGKPLGVLTDRDIVLRVVAKSLDPGVARVGDAMTAPAFCIGEDTSIQRALEKMAHIGRRRLVVVGETGRAVGVLSLDDVLETFMEDSTLLKRILREEAPSLSPTDDGRARP